MRCSEDFLWEPSRWSGGGGVAVARDHQGCLLSSSYWELWNTWTALAFGPRLETTTRCWEENDRLICSSLRKWDAAGRLSHGVPGRRHLLAAVVNNRRARRDRPLSGSFNNRCAAVDTRQVATQHFAGWMNIS